CARVTGTWRLTHARSSARAREGGGVLGGSRVASCSSIPASLPTTCLRWKPTGLQQEPQPLPRHAHLCPHPPAEAQAVVLDPVSEDDALLVHLADEGESVLFVELPLGDCRAGGDAGERLADEERERAVHGRRHGHLGAPVALDGPRP